MADKTDLVGDPETPRLGRKIRALRPFAGDSRAHAPAGAIEKRQRFDEDVDALDRPQFADANDFRGIVSNLDRCEFGFADAVAHDAHRGPRPADFGAKQVGDVGAFEQKKVGAPAQQPFELAVEAAAQRARGIDQRAAMGRIDADRVGRARRQPRQRGAFGAVAVQYVGGEEPDALRNHAQREDIGRTELAGDGDTLQTEREMRKKLGKSRIGTRAAGRRIDDEADAVAARGLAAGDVNDMAKQAAERRPQDVQDLQAWRRRGTRHLGRGGGERGSGRGLHRRDSPHVAHGANP